MRAHKVFFWVSRSSLASRCVASECAHLLNYRWRTMLLFALMWPLNPPIPAAPHHYLPGESQDQRGLPRGGREAHQGGQKHLSGWHWGARQDGEVWRRKEAVCARKWESKRFWKCREHMLWHSVSSMSKTFLEVDSAFDGCRKDDDDALHVSWTLEELFDCSAALQCMQVVFRNSPSSLALLYFSSSSSRCLISSAAWAGSAGTNAATCPPR